ncbi:MAG: hypothetical protein NWE89_16405 [Candidatus Bathyarchaeota archaeon]|nr:hypothetical protein [Candidatus Bathyarchaeota archaeon]
MSVGGMRKLDPRKDLASVPLLTLMNFGFMAPVYDFLILQKLSNSPVAGILLEEFGLEKEEYMKRTKRLTPYVY